LLGVELDGTTVEGVDADSLAQRVGLRVGDRIVSIDQVELETDAELVAAMQRGGPRKTAVIERSGEGDAKQRVELVELIIDWSDDPDEAARAARRAERRERFGPHLRPWDGESQPHG
jgi:C-terminal processing protease CtpA/Prc